MVNFADCSYAAVIRHKEGKIFYMTFTDSSGEMFLMPLWNSDEVVDLVKFWGEKSDWIAYDLAEVQWLHRHKYNY